MTSPLPSPSVIAEKIVRRARAGDQNALALIAETRVSAMQPQGQRARIQLTAINDYCARHPVPDTEVAFEYVEEGDEPHINGECVAPMRALVGSVLHGDMTRTGTILRAPALSANRNPLIGKTCAVILAYGPKLNPAKAQAVNMGSEGEEAPPNPFVTIVIHYARILQFLKENPVLCIRLHFPRVAAELGC